MFPNNLWRSSLEMPNTATCVDLQGPLNDKGKSIVITMVQKPLRRWAESESFSSMMYSLSRPSFEVIISEAAYMSKYDIASPDKFVS